MPHRGGSSRVFRLIPDWAAGQFGRRPHIGFWLRERHARSARRFRARTDASQRSSIQAGSRVRSHGPATQPVPDRPSAVRHSQNAPRNASALASPVRRSRRQRRGRAHGQVAQLVNTPSAMRRGLPDPASPACGPKAVNQEIELRVTPQPAEDDLRSQSRIARIEPRRAADAAVRKQSRHLPPAKNVESSRTRRRDHPHPTLLRSLRLCGECGPSFL